MKDRKSIFVSNEVYARIIKYGKFGETYNDVIKGILDKLESKDNK